MRSLGALVVAGLAFVLVALPSVALADGRVALVVGNGSYAHIGRLSNPENDAADMSAALRRLGFEVTTELDLDLGELNSALRAFTRRSAGADVSLVFYAGHGLEVDRVNYLLPVDARLERDTDVRFETVTLEDVLAATAGAALRLVILDACRNNPLASSMQRTDARRSISRGSFGDLDESLLGDETLVAYAAAAGTTAADGRGSRNSPYNAALLAHLEQPLELTAVFRGVRRQVLRATGSQRPWEYGSLLGDHYLAGTGDQTAPAGSFAANGWGLHDMHGNVHEWVADCWHENYARAPRDRSAWTSGADCSRRVVRGGSWNSYPVALRSANRLRIPARSQGSASGFRVARTLD